MVFKAYRRGLTVSRDPDRLLPARRRVEAQPLRRRLAPRALHAPVQPELALPLSRRCAAAARARRHGRPRDRPGGRLRPDVADPHDARLRRAHAHRGAGDPARRLRADVRTRADRRARSSARADRPGAEAGARAARRRSARSPRVRRALRGRRRVGARRVRDARARLRDRTARHGPRPGDPDRLRVVLPRAAHDAAAPWRAERRG